MSASPTKEELSNLSIVKLGNILKQNGLSSTGVKAALIERILNNKLQIVDSPPQVDDPKPISDEDRDKARRTYHRQHRDFYISTMIYQDTDEYENKFVLDPDNSSIPHLVKSLYWSELSVFPLMIYTEDEVREITDEETMKLQIPISGLPFVYLEMPNMHDLSYGSPLITIKVEAGTGKNLSWYNILQAIQQYYNLHTSYEDDYGLQFHNRFVIYGTYEGVQVITII